MTEIIGYIAIILMGVSLGMFGSGGSIFTIPILVYFFSISPLLAVTQSLLIVGITALVGGIRYTMQGSVHMKTVFFFAIPGLLGTYLARLYILPLIPDPLFSFGFFSLTKGGLLMLVFSILMIMAALSMFKKKLIYAENHSRVPPILLLTFQGLLVGITTGLIGIGGGFIIVPVLIHLLDLPMKMAVGCSLLIIALNALFGFAISYINGTSLDLNATGMILAGALVGLFIGTLMSKIILEDTMKKTFAAVILLTGAVVLIDQIRTLFTGA
jgi:uncharacterized protein